MHLSTVMKRLFVPVLAWIAVFGFVLGSGAYASPTDVLALPGKDLMTQLETEILPQIEEIFNPEQLEQFQANMTEGMSFRKAFKSLTLTPEQKTQIKTILKSVSQKDALASLTPEQKKQIYMKKKELFMPTADEITEKIETSLKDKGIELPTAVKDKIDKGLKMKDSFVPSAEAITEKIEAGMSALKDQLGD